MTYGKEFDMSLCPSSLAFSEVHSANRIEAATEKLGGTVIKRVLAFALYLLGARREDIARHLSIPVGTLFSLLTRISRLGLPAVEDRRRSHSEFLPAPRQEASKLEVAVRGTTVVVDLGGERRVVSIPDANSLQIRVFLLTLLQNGLLDRAQVADLLGYSSRHTGRMARQLAEGDVPALLDKRQGRKEGHLVTPAVKAELVQQFAVDVMARGKTSGEAISAELEDRCGITIPARTVRHHLSQLGLPAIRNTLPQLVEAVKKTSEGSSTA
jgi:hypothetical protein